MVQCVQMLAEGSTPLSFLLSPGSFVATTYRLFVLSPPDINGSPGARKIEQLAINVYIYIHKQVCRDQRRSSCSLHAAAQATTSLLLNKRFGWTMILCVTYHIEKNAIGHIPVSVCRHCLVCPKIPPMHIFPISNLWVTCRQSRDEDYRLNGFAYSFSLVFFWQSGAAEVSKLCLLLALGRVTVIVPSSFAGS